MGPDIIKNTSFLAKEGLEVFQKKIWDMHHLWNLNVPIEAKSTPVSTVKFFCQNLAM